MRAKGIGLSGVAALESPGCGVSAGVDRGTAPPLSPALTAVGRGTVISDVPSLALLQRGLNPVVAAGALLLCTWAYDGAVQPIYITLACFIFFLSAYMVTEFPLARAAGGLGVSRSLRRLCGQCAKLLAVVLLVGFATKSSTWYSRKILLTWFVVLPFALAASQAVARRLVTGLTAHYAIGRRKAIVGANRLAYGLARRMEALPGHGRVTGFFDDRDAERVPQELAGRLAGTLDDLLDYVRAGRVEVVYIALPRLVEPRVAKLIQHLQDTTVSIYYVPDVSGADPIRTCIEEVDGIPVIGLYDTPLRGVNSVIKRISDVVLSLGVLLLIWPLMLLIAAGIKLTSPGPVLFRQRRYGLDGREFRVYKFRTMTRCEDGGHIAQARRGDARVTPLGRLLRRSSLDELPQFLNVLQGSMSVVGPRPHAVAHNEQYRRRILGYMLRHKVKPGITGWAQVNGLRGETSNMDKMKARVHYDLDYLRHWSIGLDLWIALRTVFVMVRGPNAY